MKKSLFLLSLLAFAPAALADITSVTITAEEQLSEYTEADSVEFILGANIVDRTYRMTGAHQQWTDETPQTHDLTFSGLQSASIGGALYIKDELTMEKLKGVEFSGNSASSGGAICGYARSGVSISGNESVLFSGNTATNYGGAIYGYNSGAVTISGNDSVEFLDNSAAILGGAIYTAGTLNITDNGSVTFRGNYDKGEQNAEYCLRSIYMSGGELNLAAGSGQSITFYDPLYATSGSTVTLSGDIVFSGKHAEEDLQKLKANPTLQELLQSRTSEVYAETNLLAGRLSIEDGAVFKGNGVDCEGSGTALRLADGTLAQGGASVVMAAGTTLELQGSNAVTAQTLDMQDGSALAFTLGSSNTENAALGVNGTFNQGGKLNIVLQADEIFRPENRFILISMQSGEEPGSWDATQITLSGLTTDTGCLSWEGGVLYYNARLTWSAEAGRIWNNQDANWSLGEYSFGDADGMNVEFTDAASGDVTLVGALAPESVLVNNSAGHDYTFTGAGRLTGAMRLAKEGAGKLTINTANNYSGGTLIAGGTVVMGNEDALGSGPVSLINGGELTTSGNLLHITARHAEAEGILQEVRISDSLIAGTDRLASLVDGLAISCNGNLALQDLTLTADNSVSVGDHTISLSNVTIKLSDDIGQLVEGVYYFNLSDLFHCAVEMENVTFDAADLTLPQDFNPATNAIAFDLGDAELSDAAAAGGITLRMGGYGSQTVSIDKAGNPVFSNLVPTPEPSTGTLSLLALCALAARRRRR